MKVCTIVGARPQFIKAATVSRVIRNNKIYEILVHTGQHYDDNLSGVFFEEMEIPKPDYNLGIGSGLHGAQTGRMLESIEGVLILEKPDVVIVYGDTNSTLAGALAAVKLNIPVAHVEAGLRSFNRNMPEEINRILTDHASDILFTPTQIADTNLMKEGIAEEKIYNVGDVMYDAALYYSQKAEKNDNVLKFMGLRSREYVLSTIHRQENTNDINRLKNIFDGLSMVAKELTVVVPLHPSTRNVLLKEGLLAQYSNNIKLIEPVGYLEMIALEKNALKIATDSGGIQKEAYFFNVPCITLREETEWVELVEHGYNKLVSPHSAEAVKDGILKFTCDQWDDCARCGVELYEIGAVKKAPISI